MLPLSRASRLAVSLARPSRRALSSTSQMRSTTHDNPVPVNDPSKTSPGAAPPAHPTPNTSATPVNSVGNVPGALVEDPAEAEKMRQMQAPNRTEVWSKSQRPRNEAMVGPRFEQVIMETQPRPMSAIELVHKQPVRWTKDRTVSCNGGGGPLGHPRIFINVDKPEICWCNYCGAPYAHEHHRKTLEAQPSTTYPLDPTGDVAQTDISGSATGRPFENR